MINSHPNHRCSETHYQPHLEPAADRPEFEPAVDLDRLSAVEIKTETLQKRERQIMARLPIPYPAAKVWHILTDYEALPSFIPNLKVSKRLEHPQGGIRLEQVGTQRLLHLNFSARVVLDLEEQFPHRISFEMVEGDFKAYSGCWLLESDSSPQTGTCLCYFVRVIPKRTMPIALIENRICRDLPVNLLAIRQRVEEVFSQS